jgi:hypothetical protein
VLFLMSRAHVSQSQNSKNTENNPFRKGEEPSCRAVVQSPVSQPQDLTAEVRATPILFLRQQYLGNGANGGARSEKIGQGEPSHALKEIVPEIATMPWK